MTDEKTKNTKPNEDEESFATLFEANPQTPGDQHFAPGDEVTGKVVQIETETVFVDYGGKMDGYADKAEFLDEDGNLSVKIGDEVSLKLIAYTSTGPRLGTSLSQSKDDVGMELLGNAFESGVPIEGFIAKVNKGGFDVFFSETRAFCPISQIDINYCEEPEVYIGTTQKFLVAEFDEEKKNVIVSRRALLEKERAEKRKETMEKLVLDAVFRATVMRIVDFGAFVDIGGIEGLIHVSEISRKNVAHPKDVLKVGQVVEVQVIKIDKDNKGRDKIGLSMRALEADPWEEGLLIKEGDILKGTVRRLAAFGAFVEVADGVDGLVHVSEISDAHVNHPKDELAEGEEVEVKVLAIDTEKRRISLSIREAKGGGVSEAPEAMDGEENFRKGNVIRRRHRTNEDEKKESDEAIEAKRVSPDAAWEEAEKSEREAGKPKEVMPRIGLVTKGVINGIMPYGLFIDLPECGDKQRGLLHNSQLPETGGDVQKGLAEGQEMEVEIIKIDEKGRISLSRKSIMEKQERQQLEKFMKTDKQTASMGTLGDLLKGVKLDEE